MKEQKLKKHLSTSDKTTNDPPLREEVNSQLKKLLTGVLTLSIATVAFTLAIVADYLIIRVISWAFASAVNSDQFVAYLFEGIQKLSVLGTALAYILYLIRSLYRDLRETKITITEDREKIRIKK